MKTKAIKSTTTFEINDGDKIQRKCDYAHNGSSSYRYTDLFIDFIRTLGYDVEQLYNGSRTVKIDGIEMDIYTGNASYMSRNGFTREESVRLPHNRFVALRWPWEHGNKYIVKVLINQEIKKAGIIARIDRAIAERKQVEQNAIDRKKADKENTEAVAQHFLKRMNLDNIVRSIKIHEGNITFFTKMAGYTITASNNWFVSYNLYSNEISSGGELQGLFNDLSDEEQNIRTLQIEITVRGEIDDHLKPWAKTAHNRSYNVVKKEYSEY